MAIGYKLEASKFIKAAREPVSLANMQDDMNNAVFGVDDEGKRYWRGDVEFEGSVRADNNGNLEFVYEITLADGDQVDVPWCDPRSPDDKPPDVPAT